MATVIIVLKIIAIAIVTLSGPIILWAIFKYIMPRYKGPRDRDIKIAMWGERKRRKR